MKAGGGRLKGNAYERAISKLIVEAFSENGITSQHCFRTPGSGGHRFASKIDPGDLQLQPKLARIFPFSIECKHYRKIGWLELLRPSPFTGHKFNRNSGKIIDWWKQCCASALAQKKRRPLLIMKQNSSDNYCILRQRDYQEIVRQNGVQANPPIVATKLNGEPVRMILFSCLLRICVANCKKKAA